MSYEVPNEEQQNRRLRKDIAENRDLIRFTPSSTNADTVAIGAGSHDLSTGVKTGNLVLNPERHYESIQISWTGGSGTLNIGDVITTTVGSNTWEGKFVFLVGTGNSTAGTGIFEPQWLVESLSTPRSVFPTNATTLNEVSTPAKWTANYTNNTVSNYHVVTQSASMIMDKMEGGNPSIKNIFGAKGDGQFTTIKPKEGKTLVLKPNGNIDVSQDTNVLSTEIAILQFQEDNITPNSDGNWTLVSSGGGSGGNSIKTPCRVATTGNNVAPTAIGSTVDGVTIVVDDRVLYKDQTAQKDNGIYVCTNVALGVATMERASDMPNASTIEGGLLVYINEGTVNGDNLFGLTTNGSIVVGTGNQAWANLTGGGWVGTATSDLNMNTFNINGLDQLIFSSATSTDLPVWNTSDYGMEVSGGTTPTGLDYRIPSSKAHKFLVNTTKIAEINSVSLDMNAHKITSVLNPTNPQDAMTLDYFNTNGIWLELDGSTTMTGNINAGNNNLINVNDILTTRSDGTARLQTTGGTATSDFVGLYLSTNTDYFLRQGTDYIFEWDKSDGEFTIFTDVVLGDATTDRITFNAKSASILDMNANKITGVQNPSNPTDVVTLDYFNSTGDGQWLELDGTGTMTGNINAGNNNLINVNDILTTRDDGVSRLITSGGTSTSNFVGLTLATGTDYYLRKSSSDGSGYVFEWDNSVPSFKLSVPTIVDSTLQVNGNTTLGNANTDTITFTAKSATELNMDAHKITGVLNPTNPTDVVTLDYFNSTGDTQWLELDGTGTMTGDINVGNNNIDNVNAVNVVRSDSTARMAIQGGTGTTTQVLFDAVTNVDVRFTEALADRFEIQNSTNTIRSHVDLNMEGNNILNGSIDTGLIDSGILGIARGGTGNSTNTRGDILYSPTSGTWSRLPVGSANQVLTSDGTDVSWQNASGGSQTPWTSTINADNNPLIGANYIQFNNLNQSVNPANTVPFIQFDNYDMTFNIPELKGYEININGSTIMSVIDTTVSVAQGTKIQVNTSTSRSGFKDVGTPSDPTTSSSGDMYYNSTSNEYKFYNGSSWNTFGGSGGGVNNSWIWTDDETNEFDEAIYLSNAVMGRDTQTTNSVLPYKDTVYWVPIYFSKACTINAIGLQFTIAGTGSMGLMYGLYDTYADQNYPKSLIDGGSSVGYMGTGLGGNFTLTTSFAVPSAGLYFIAIKNDTNTGSAFRVQGGGSTSPTPSLGHYYVSGTSNGFMPITGYYSTEYGNLPSTSQIDDDMSVTYYGGTNIPLIFVRVS